jgi:RNA polymerase sigma-70 factor, ECF subfamily
LYSEEDLALAVQQGDESALTQLIERHHSPLLGFLYRMTGGDRTLAEDLVQETFLRMMRSIHSYHYPRRFKSWLYAIATNVTRDYFKRAETRRTISVAEFDPEQFGASDEAGLSAGEEQMIAQALARLPDHQRSAVIMRYYQDLSLAEIAEALDIPVGTVKSRLSLGLARLKPWLEQVIL